MFVNRILADLKVIGAQSDPNPKLFQKISYFDGSPPFEFRQEESEQEIVAKVSLLKWKKEKQVMKRILELQFSNPE